MKVPEFIQFIQQTINTITPIVNSLADYNVTPQTITSWQEILDQLVAVNKKPINAINHRKSLNNQAIALLEQTMTYIRDIMDPLALNFSETEIPYFSEYMNNRRLTNITIHTKFKVRVTNDVNEPQVNIQVVQNNFAGNKKFTDINGEATVYVKINEGPDTQPIYYLTIGTGATAIQTGPVEIKKGHLVTRSYIIQPSGFIIPAPVTENNNVPA